MLLKVTEQEITTWYSPQVGMIKQKLVNDKDLTVLVELEKYEPAH